MEKSDVIPLMVPDIGDAEKIELVGWMVRPGDRVAQGEELCELVTDKAAFPVESPHEGTILEILVDSPAEVKVGDTLARLQRNS